MMSRYVTSPLTRLTVYAAKLKPRATQWARGFVVIALAVALIAALIAVYFVLDAFVGALMPVLFNS